MAFMKSERVKGILLFLVSILCMHLTDILIKLSGNQLHFSQEVFLRFASSALLLMPIAVFNKQYFSFSVNNIALLILRAVLIFCGTFFWFSGVKTSSINLVTAIAFSIPVMTLIFSVFFLNESLSKNKVIANITGLVGVLITIGGNLSHSGLPSLFYLLMASICYALFSVVSKQCTNQCENNEHLFSTLFYTSLFAALLASPIAIYQWQELTAFDFGGCILLGLLANLTSYCLLAAYHFEEASFLAPFMYSEMILSLISGVFLFNEELYILTIAGSVVIFISNLLICRDH